MRGAALQAGLYPNPTIGFEEDTLGTGTRPGYLGGFFNQVIKTGNKLQLQRAVAVMDLRNAEAGLHAGQDRPDAQRPRRLFPGAHRAGEHAHFPRPGRLQRQCIPN